MEGKLKERYPITNNEFRLQGIRVTVKLTIQNRAAKVDVEPNATSLIIKAAQPTTALDALRPCCRHSAHGRL